MNRDIAIGLLRRTGLPLTAPGTPVKEETGVTAGTASHPDDPHVEALGTVRQVTPPPAARALSALCHVGYEDAFLAGTGPAQDRTGEQSARAILEDAPVSTRTALSRGWSALGLRLGFSSA
jgi:hypothetical protein